MIGSRRVLIKDSNLGLMVGKGSNANRGGSLCREMYPSLEIIWRMVLEFLCKGGKGDGNQRKVLM